MFESEREHRGRPMSRANEPHASPSLSGLTAADRIARPGFRWGKLLVLTALSSRHVRPWWPKEQGRSPPTCPSSSLRSGGARAFKGFRVEHLKHDWVAASPARDLRELVRARPRGHPRATGGRARYVRACLGGGAVTGRAI
jgi:hypothetical protein